MTKDHATRLKRTTAGTKRATPRRGESPDTVQGFRAAYEALIEPLVNVTIKLAAAETEQQALQAQITALEGELADRRAGLRTPVCALFAAVQLVIAVF